MEFEMNPYVVYVKSNSEGYITAVNSSAFLSDVIGWTEIDSGYGDKYHHAQGNYFPESVLTAGSAYRYMLVDGSPVECTPEEITQQEAANQPEAMRSYEDRIRELETQNELLTQCVLELSEVVYA